VKERERERERGAVGATTARKQCRVFDYARNKIGCFFHYPHPCPTLVASLSRKSGHGVKARVKKAAALKASDLLSSATKLKATENLY
jgi:hypothetical protein